MFPQKVTQHRKKGRKKFQKKNLKDWTKWNRKMGGRSFNITSGAFKDTLMHSRLVCKDQKPKPILNTKNLLEKQ